MERIIVVTVTDTTRLQYRDFTKPSLLSKCCTVSNMCICNCTLALEKSVAFPVAIFVKLTNAQQHYKQISGTKI
jgi:hypothetical protein